MSVPRHAHTRLPAIAPRLTALAASLASMIACGDGGGAPDPALRDTLVVAGVSAPASAVVVDTLTLSPAVVVTDGAGRPLADVAVSYEVTAGGGRVESADARTGTTGRARVGRWVLGETPGLNTLRVVAAGRAVTFSTTAAERPWRWRLVATPMDDRQVTALVFDPQDDARWYAVSFQKGLYVSTDAGVTWRQALTGTGINRYGIAIDRRDPRLVYVALGPNLYVSTDRGATWERRKVFPHWIRSILLSTDGTLYVAPQWGAGEVPGVYKSSDQGRTFVHHPYGVPQGTQILTWHLFEHPGTGALYAANEIADHPQPYRAPIFRSQDKGVTWHDVTGAVPWHAVQMAYDEDAGRLYAVTEGTGVWVSTDDATTWTRVNERYGSALLVDPRRPGWMYLGQYDWSFPRGGVSFSSTFGAAPVPIGLGGNTIAALVPDNAWTRIYAVVYGIGIHVTTVGSTPP